MPKSYVKTQEELEQKLRNRIRVIVIFLGVLIISFTFFAPQVGSIFGIFSKYRNQQIEQQNAKPAPPTFTNAPAATNKESINLSGFAAPGSSVVIYVNGPEGGRTTADNSGKFEFIDLPLIKGRNTIFAKATSEQGLESEKSQTIQIEYDNAAPEIEVTSPKDGDFITNLNERITITGTVNEKVTLTINEKAAIVKPDLTFEFLLGVGEGKSEIKIKAVDEAGNEKEETLSVTYKKG